MKPIFLTLSFCLCVIALSIVGCDTQPAPIVIPDVPKPSFTIAPKAGAINTYTLKSTTSDAFLFKWDLGAGSSPDGKTDGAETSVYFPNKGNFEVKLSAWGKGGSATASQMISVAADDPNACRGNMALLTNCSERTWKLVPEAGAMVVGPDPNAVWWANALADVQVRSCHFNDEYTFTAKGVFKYDNKGDFWADTDGNGAITPSDLGVTPGCQPASVWPTKYKAWDSATNAFSITDKALQVKGLGAWMGLYKVGEDGEVTTPSSNVTFTIQSISATKMVIFKQYSWGVWKFTFVAKN